MFHKKINLSSDGISNGMHKKDDTKHMHGICRVMENKSRLIEAVYFNNEKNGYGRIIYESGNYYLGMFKGGFRHGYGVFVLPNG